MSEVERELHELREVTADLANGDDVSAVVGFKNGCHVVTKRGYKHDNGADVF